MSARDWNDHYASGCLPWDTADADELLVDFVRAGRVAPGRALDVGAGTGTNARWLAAQGFDVLGVDIAPLAVEQARARGPGPRFEVHDFLAGAPAGPFDLVFDRGCFHVFDAADDRARFAARVAECLAPGGVWLSLIGSTEGPARGHGPPRRSAADIAAAIEPVLAIAELAAVTFAASPWMSEVAAWRCVARPRLVPAQPSTGHG